MTTRVRRFSSCRKLGKSKWSMCACDNSTRSTGGSSSTNAAGSISRLMPTVRGPRFNPMRLLNTGSVKIVKPSNFSNTVLWPSQAACRPRSGHNFGRGRCGAETISRLYSFETCRNSAGPARRKNLTVSGACLTCPEIVAPLFTRRECLWNLEWFTFAAECVSVEVHTSILANVWVSSAVLAA